MSYCLDPYELDLTRSGTAPYYSIAMCCTFSASPLPSLAYSISMWHTNNASDGPFDVS